MKNDSTGLRVLLAALALAGWSVAVWFASHRSEAPTWLGRYSSGYLVILLGLLGIAIAATATQLKPIHSRLLPHRRWISALLLAPIGLVVLGETLVRLFDPWSISYYDEERRLHLAKLPDAELMYRYPAGLTAEFGGVAVSTNASGWRERPLERARPDERRVVLLGDSVTFGWGVADDERFSRVIEAPLTAALAVPVRAINTGVGNYNTEQEQRLLVRHWEELQPDLVVLVYVDNDLDPTPVAPLETRSLTDLTGRSPPQVIRYWADRSRLVQLATHMAKYGLEPMPQEIDLGSEGWARSVSALRELVDFSREHETPLMVVFFRWQTTPASDAMRREIAAVLAEGGINLFDTAAWFDGANLRELRNSAIDGHPNAGAHAILARELVAAIVATGM